MQVSIRIEAETFLASCGNARSAVQDKCHHGDVLAANETVLRVMRENEIAFDITFLSNAPELHTSIQNYIHHVVSTILEEQSWRFHHLRLLFVQTCASCVDLLDIDINTVDVDVS